MVIRPAGLADVARWAALRAALWPEDGLQAHRDAALAAVQLNAPDRLVLVAADGQGAVVGFAEASLRHEYVNGCETSPVAFLEGVFVEPDCRGGGVGQALCRAVQAWGGGLGCRELASDASLENTASHAFHTALGFEETERVVYFRMAL